MNSLFLIKNYLNNILNFRLLEAQDQFQVRHPQQITYINPNSQNHNHNLNKLMVGHQIITMVVQVQIQQMIITNKDNNKERKNKNNPKKGTKINIKEINEE